jgi:hypothetical protein
MKTLDIYLDFSFLKFFLESEPQDKYSDDYQNWLDFLKFLEKHDFLKIITPNRNKEMKKYDFKLQLRQLLRDKTFRQDFFNDFPSNTDNYKISIKFEYNNQITNPHSVLFIEFSTEQCQELENKYGYFFINWENFKTKWKLLNPRNHQSFVTVSEKGNLKSWSDFSYLKHYANSIVIVDRYIFDGNYNHNLVEMLSNILSNLQNTICFDITIIIGNKNNNKDFDINSTDGKTLVKSIEKIFKAKWSNYQFTIIQLFKRGRKGNNQEAREDISLTHDRRIITNYFYFSSGDSITYESQANSMQANTDFHIYSIFDSKTFETVQQRLAEFNFQMNAKIHVNNFIGNKQNRLLE